MKKLLLTLISFIYATVAMADIGFYDSFEYGNHDGEIPVGWNCDDNSWVCGYLEKDHNRVAHHGNWYVYTNNDDAWMFMQNHMSSQLKYRYSYWAISEGDYDVEVWAGSAPDVENMTTVLYTSHVGSGDYEKFYAYIDSLASDYEYFGIHAIAESGASYLTIDEVKVDQVGKYDFAASPVNAYTELDPNSPVTYRFDVQNLGYEPIDVIISPIYQDFTDVHFFVEGSQCTTFHLEPDESKQVIMEATLLPSTLPGTTCWIDIQLILDCNCATAMTTLWVTVREPAEIIEYPDEQGLQQVEIYDLTGKKVNPDNLKPGVYIERTISSQKSTTKKILKK